jgi:hypothetical protein
LTARSGDRDERRFMRPRRETAYEDLDAGVIFGIADQPVGQPERAAVGGPRLADADTGVARPAQILDARERSGGEDPQAAVHQAFVSTKRTRTPGRSSAAGSR